MSLDTILASGELKEVVVELDSAKRSDGTLKTWYYSVFFRETGSTDTPANTTIPQYLVSAGPLSQGLSEDMLFAGLAASDPGSIIIVQPTPAVDQISQLIDYTFQGYECRVKIGLASALLYTDFVRYRTAIIESEPDIVLTSAGIQATVKLLSMTRRLEEEALIVNHYVGIPHCARFSTATASAVVPRIAAYDLIRFTGMIRFRCTAPPSATITLHSKVVSSTNNNWQLVLSTSGTVQLFGSGGGVADLQILSGNMCDGTWKTVVFARDTNLTAYLMINNVVIGTDTALSGSPNAAVANLIFNFRSGGTQAIDIQDARLYDRYIPPDEARGLSSIRSDGDDLGCIGLWRFDDNTSNKANDYSANNNDTNAFGGTVNVDYSWQASDLGEPELAGRPYPVVQGNVLNVQAQLIDNSRHRFRANNDSVGWHSSGSNTSITVRSQGTVLTGGGVDYTTPSDGGGGVFSTTAAEAEPVTFDLVNNGTAEENVYPAAVAQNLLVNRTRLTSNIDTTQVAALGVLAPWPTGYYTNQEPNAQVALQDILGNSGFCYYENALGNIFPDFYLPPLGYGPYGDPCIDLRTGYISFGDIADVSGSLTLTIWFKSNLQDQTGYEWGGAEPNLGSGTLISKGDSNYHLYFQAIGSGAGKIKFRTAGVTLSSPLGVIEPSTWYFIAAVFDDSANTQKLYLGKQGGTLAEIASVANVGSQITNSIGLSIGSNGRYTWGAVQYAQIWNVAQSPVSLQALMDVPILSSAAIGVTNLVGYVPMNNADGTGNVMEILTSSVGTINGTTQWCPKLTVNLSDTPSVKLSEFHHIKPAYDIQVNHSRNRRVMSDAEIDTSIVGDDRIKLKREWKNIPYHNPTTLSRFKGARKIRLDSAITDRESAQHLLRAIVNRFGTDRYIGVLDFPPGLNISSQACGLKLMDEIGVTASIPSQLSTPRSFRVVSVTHDPIKLSTKIVFAG